MNKVLFGGMNNNSFYVNLVDYPEPFICCSYPKYEFLDKLKEWGVNIEVEEKYLKQDFNLRKYVSNNEIKVSGK